MSACVRKRGSADKRRCGYRTDDGGGDVDDGGSDGGGGGGGDDGGDDGDGCDDDDGSGDGDGDDSPIPLRRTFYSQSSVSLRITTTSLRRPTVRCPQGWSS